MDVKELMLGDLVTFKDCQFDNPIPIKMIAIGYQDREKDCLLQINGDDVCDIMTIDDEIVGIPLTAEILEKNGFTRFGTDYILKERHFGLKNPSTPSNYLDNYWLLVSIKSVHIEYVHQLQHALRLCGIEKEITL